MEQENNQTTTVQEERPRLEGPLLDNWSRLTDTLRDRFKFGNAFNDDLYALIASGVPEAVISKALKMPGTDDPVVYELKFNQYEDRNGHPAYGLHGFTSTLVEDAVRSQYFLNYNNQGKNAIQAKNQLKGRTVFHRATSAIDGAQYNAMSRINFKGTKDKYGNYPVEIRP
ncbi:hypothetical protein [Puia dinghuensis]|uniref:Uncharacterized protein n=1 Tax=Puia dinghuensis TaxID=1792502 RepID=A0A8J2UB89_9BACT|nr:hypothetical protein [Puia dinghuensis]GGA93171.1 hypothetical protein GCM10011511_15730 [Puia dinghuensis]